MSFWRKMLQILILVILVQVAVVSLVYIGQFWRSNLNNIFPTFSNDFGNVKYKYNVTFNRFLQQLPTDDDTRLLNLTKFSYKIKKETLCQTKSLLLLVAVSSAVANQLERKVIRETWGHPDSEVKIVFILGDTNDTNLQKLLQIEDMAFHDLVQGNFLDSYKNMSYKSTMGLKYAIYNCPSVKFIMKCDDDVLINMPLLKNFLKHDLSLINPKNSIFCNVNYAGNPIRDSIGELRKWYVSYEEWPEEYFPTYCAGWYSIMTLDVAFDIYRHAQNSTYFWIDDVFLTGIAARNLQGFKHVDLEKFTLAYRDFNDVINGKLGDISFLLGQMNMTPEDIQVLWQYVLSRPVKKSILNDIDYIIIP